MCGEKRVQIFKRLNGVKIFMGEYANSGSKDISVLALVKGEERYIFLYDDENKAETLRTFGRYASNPDLTFTWYDAVVLSQKIRRQSRRLRQDGEVAHEEPSNLEMPLSSDDWGKDEESGDENGWVDENGDSNYRPRPR